MMRLRDQILSAFILLAGTCNTAQALDWQMLWQRPDQVAYKKLQDGDAGAAAEIFNDPQWRGVGRYRAGEFDEAQKEFSTMVGETGLYNQAVTAVQQGEYDSAIEKFESLLSQNGDHSDAKHNLEIARELALQQEQQEQQQQQEDSNQDQQSEEQQEQDQKDQSEGDGSSSDSDSATDETGDTESSDEQSGGELTSSPEDAAQQQSQASAEQSEEEAEQGEQTVAEQAETDANESQDDENTISASAPPSESEQATEQWLRRIPDDPSQLLRNKIKLNHMIEHADVRDMREPW